MPTRFEWRSSTITMKMRQVARVRSLGALASVLALLAGCAATQSDKAGSTVSRRAVVLTLANFFPDSFEVSGFAADVSRLSHGSIRIAIESRWRFGQVAFEDGLIRDVRAGKADLGVAGSRAWDSVGVRSFRALGTPLLIDSYSLQDAVLNSGLTPHMLRGLGALGLTGIGVLPEPLRYPVGITRPLLRPSDYVGESIGVQQSLVASTTFRALGAKPVWFAVQAPISNFDGVEVGIENIEGRENNKPVTVTANVVLWPRPLVLFAGQRALARLTSDQRRILVQAAADDVDRETAVDVANAREFTADLCRARLVRFVDATPVELAALRRAVAPVYAELDADPENRQQIVEIEAMRTDTPPESPLRCPTTLSPRIAVGPLDGVYQYKLDYAELEAAHPGPGEINSGNVGTFTFVLDRGHFAETVENPQACTWNYGTVSVTASNVSLLYSGGGGIPAGTANQPGEQFTLGWSLYRDSLTMRRVPGAISPTPFVAEPWLRVSTTPARSYFSNRCPPPANALPG
jgi:TRAP-type C4-dicarboxylate transport system substrate-binding protein